MTDQHWNRIVVGELISPWAQALGEYGNDTLEFNNPMGLAVYGGRYWVLADGFNNRGIVYSVDWFDGDLEFQFYLENGFDYVPDVAAGVIPSSESVAYDTAQIWVVDRGNARIALFDVSGNHVMDYPIPGKGILLKRPTSVCIGRNFLTNHHANWIYVVDDETNIVYCMSTKEPHSVSYTPVGTFPSDARLVSVDVDHFGNVYVVDNDNSQIYLLSRGLQKIIAVFGSQGEADNQFLWPNSFHLAEGWRDLGPGTRLEPIVTGNAFATEYFTESTGIRSFVSHGDLLEYELSYIPMISECSKEYIRIDLTVSGLSKCNITIFDNSNNLVYSYSQELILPGNIHYEFPIETINNNSNYLRVEIKLNSKYTNEIISIVKDSVAVKPEKYIKD